MKQILDGVIVSNYLERALNHFVFDTSEELKITRENFINFFQYLECFEL